MLSRSLVFVGLGTIILGCSPAPVGEDETAAAAAEARPGVRSASLSWANTCVVTRLGGAECWGSNYDGQLGNGEHTDSYRPVPVHGLGSDVAKVSTAGAYACAVTVHGKVSCWGLNSNGQLGNGTTTSSAVPTSVVGLGASVVELATGADHACALTNDGRVKCWGANDLGQLGTATAASSSTPVEVLGLGGSVSAITSSGSHTCALLRTRTVKCWGGGERGQLGNGATASSATPVTVAGLTNVRAINAGLEHTCAVSDHDGSAHCWGRNDFGQLGDGTTQDASRPRTVAGIGAPVALLGAGGYHNCVVTTRGAARCWGLGLSGQLGNGDSTASASAPVPVRGLDTQVTSIALGLYHSCATTGAGALVCWGFNGSAGALGIEGSTESSNVPVSVSP